MATKRIGKKTVTVRGADGSTVTVHQKRGGSNRTRKERKANGSKRDGYEVIFLRVRPEVREMLEAHVAGMNKNRRPGDPAFSVTGVIHMAIANTFGIDPKQTVLRLSNGKELHL